MVKSSKPSFCLPDWLAKVRGAHNMFTRLRPWGVHETVHRLAGFAVNIENHYKMDYSKSEFWDRLYV